MTPLTPHLAATIDIRFTDDLSAHEISFDESIESNDDHAESPLNRTDSCIGNNLGFIPPMPILCTPIHSSIECSSIPAFRPLSVRLHPRLDCDMLAHGGMKISSDQPHLDICEFQNSIPPSFPTISSGDVHAITEQSYMDSLNERWDSRCTAEAKYLDFEMNFWSCKSPPFLSNLDDDTDSEDEIVMEYNRKLPTLKLRRSSRPVF